MRTRAIDVDGEAGLFNEAWITSASASTTAKHDKTGNGGIVNHENSLPLVLWVQIPPTTT